MIEYKEDIEELKALVIKNNGISEILIYTDFNRHFVVGIDVFEDCMGDYLFYVDSRYNVKLSEIKKWYILKA